jgi:Protein of unknown function (DUF2911)
LSLLNRIAYFKQIMIKVALVFTLLIAAMPDVRGQEALAPRPSPLAVVSFRYEDSYIKIVYSQPQRRGRTIIGGVVPFGQVWRLGANEATEMTLTKDVFINGSRLPAGTYSLFAIPEPTKWTMIINSDVGLWGAYNYNPRKDVMRFDIPVQPIPNAVFEPFTIAFDEHNNKADLILSWERTRVVIPIELIEAHE